MNKLLIIIPVVCISFAVSGQQQTFLYKRANGLIQLISESDTIVLFNYVRAQDGTRVRKVEMNGGAFIFSISKRKKDRTQKIYNEERSQFATVSLGTKNRYDIIMEDGTVLECSVTGRNWTYTTGGREVIKGSCKKENGLKKIVIQSNDLLHLSPAVLLSCLERATDRYVSSANTAPVIITAAAIALIRTATMNNSEPPY